MADIKLLDCTLRDGTYINKGEFGDDAISGIIKYLALSNIDMIELGWLTNKSYIQGLTYFHTVEDIRKYIPQNHNSNTSFAAMIGYGDYDLKYLSDYDGKSIDTIRMFFSKEKFSEALNFAKEIKYKGYKLCLQAANTQNYSDLEILHLCSKINEIKPESISIVDTSGVMYPADINRSFMLMNNNIDKKIKIGFHSHNNLQLSFANTMLFCELGRDALRNIIVDSSLCGMGRGAGNTCTELIADYLNKQHGKNYDMDMIMDIIDIYLRNIMEKHNWGYSIPYCIAGQLGSHVNNVKYLQNTHKVNYRDMRNIIQKIEPKNRTKNNSNDYSGLESLYVSYIDSSIDDVSIINLLNQKLENKNILIIAPGKNAILEYNKIKNFINQNNLITIGVNSILDNYNYDFVFFSNKLRFIYANGSKNILDNTKVILTSNIKKTSNKTNEYIVNFNSLKETKWKYFDNSTIMLLRLLSKLKVKSIYIAGFDGYNMGEYVSYADTILQTNLSDDEKIIFNEEIQDMLNIFIKDHKKSINIEFITNSIFSI